MDRQRRLKKDSASEQVRSFLVMLEIAVLIDCGDSSLTGVTQGKTGGEEMETQITTFFS